MRDQCAETERTSLGDVAVIIVNYGTAKLAAQAVRSVLQYGDRLRAVHVHLLDNASPSGDADALAQLHRDEGWHGRVTLHPQQENLGFGRGNNVVIDQLCAQVDPPEFVFLLNPDATLRNDAIDRLARFMQERPEVGVAGACISAPGGGPVTAAFRFPTPTVEFVSAASFGPLSRFAPDRTLWLAPDISTRRVDWVAGAAVMLRLKALKEVGFFDPDFFLYFEEAELMSRMAVAGWECWYIEDAHIEHHEGAATDVRSGDPIRKRRPSYWYHSQMLYDAKTNTRGGAIWQATARFAGAAFHTAVSRLRRRASNLPTRYLTDYTRHVLWPLATGELAPPAKPETTKSYDRTPSRAQRDIESKTDLTCSADLGQTNNNPDGISFWSLVAEDFRTQGSKLFNQGFWALFWHRFGNWRMSIKPRLLRLPFSITYKVAEKLLQWSAGIFLPYTVYLGRRVRLEYFGSMILVARAIGNDVIIRQNTTFGIARLDQPDSRPTIGDRVNIGVGAVILGNITIGADTTIGANAVVNKDQPAKVVVAGVPARIIRQL